ncbi:hypothetical protein DAPPUDRAFT_300386 [Daphnia pulex]|uniref:CUB domain-containing protein n=1 Tax=Daphnia pulex TaxID=6669 RepID=E9G4C8_DAPPU|nr:hypothetical protein DAPPUDRAFT_300386 [Daphnia pulex]|eukprot:EFX85269.1 hypothetical protein DAPPUDRAFT_300386 [Daphnia pulex]
MKSLLIFVLVFCLAIIAVEAQTTAKGQVTTGKPVTTTAATTIKSFKVCQDTNSTAASGSIQPLDGLKPVATGSPRTCSFSIVVPSNQHVQMSCSVAKLTPVTTVLDNTGGSYTVSSSLIFDGTLDLVPNIVIVPNRVYTSYSNAMTVIYRVVNATDTFNCNWKTIQAPTTTTDFKLCRDSETTAASGSIQTLRESAGNGATYTDGLRACPFFINSSPNRQIQMSCNSFNDIDLFTFRKITEMYWFQPKFNKTTANSNQIDLLLLHQATDTVSPINCNWTTTTPTTATSNFNNCVNVKSTTTNGIISQSLANTNNELKTCLFSIFVPLGQRIQMSCTNVNIGSSSSLMLSGIAKISTSGIPFREVSTSINNRLDFFASYRNGEVFQCNWTTITIPPTTDFKVCRDGETTEASGTITPLENLNVDMFSKYCRFTITAPANKRVQMSCSVINQSTDIELYEFNTYISYIAKPPVVSQTYTSKGNQMNLNLNLKWSPFLKSPPLFKCAWTFV